MYYSVLIEVTEGNNSREHTMLDQPDLDEIIKKIIIPYAEGNEFIVDGYRLNESKISRLKIVSSKLSIKSILESKQKAVPAGRIRLYTETSIISYNQSRFIQDITDEVLSKYSGKLKRKGNNIDVNNNKVFIVHGHDDAIKYDVSNFLRKVGLEPIILHEQANQGKTIIEKIEKECADVGYGIVLYTPCDKGETAEMSPNDMQYRARQNVVFEHGYLIGKLGRKKVCALVEGDIEKPSDIDGVLYISYQPGIWELAVGKELRSAGYDIDLNKL